MVSAGVGVTATEAAAAPPGTGLAVDSGAGWPVPETAGWGFLAALLRYLRAAWGGAGASTGAGDLQTGAEAAAPGEVTEPAPSATAGVLGPPGAALAASVPVPQPPLAAGAGPAARAAAPPAPAGGMAPVGAEAVGPPIPAVASDLAQAGFATLEDPGWSGSPAAAVATPEGAQGAAARGTGLTAPSGGETTPTVRPEAGAGAPLVLPAARPVLAAPPTTEGAATPAAPGAAADRAEVEGLRHVRLGRDGLRGQVDGGPLGAIAVRVRERDGRLEVALEPARPEAGRMMAEHLRELVEGIRARRPHQAVEAVLVSPAREPAPATLPEVRGEGIGGSAGHGAGRGPGTGGWHGGGDGPGTRPDPGDGRPAIPVRGRRATAAGRLDVRA